MDKFLFLSRKIGLGDRAGQPCGAARVFFVHADFELGPLTGHRPTSDQQRSTTKFSFEDPIHIMFPRNVILRLSGNPLPYFRALGPPGLGSRVQNINSSAKFQPDWPRDHSSKLPPSTWTSRWTPGRSLVPNLT